MTRMMTGSILKYRARPEQTPAMILSSALLVKRLAIIKLPSTTLQICVRLNECFLSYSTIIFTKIIVGTSLSSSKSSTCLNQGKVFGYGLE